VSVIFASALAAADGSVDAGSCSKGEPVLMRPLPFTNLSAGIVFDIAIAVFAVTQLVAGLGSLRSGGWRPRRSDRYDRGSLAVVMITGLAGIAAAAAVSSTVPIATIAPGVPAIRVAVFAAGIAALLVGTIFRQWAIITLGKSFTYDVRVASDQRVISSGPYRWLRHPSYTGLLLSFAGLGLAFGNWLSLATVVILPAAGLIRRIHVEEAALRTQLGSAYEEFAIGRKRLVPGVW
jgi:protein-S-isoprenylcysteine O-methyltransferase Ste14